MLSEPAASGGSAGSLGEQVMVAKWWGTKLSARDVECLVLFAIQHGSGLTGAFEAPPQELSGIQQ